MWEFLGQGLNLCHSSDNTGSLTCWATWELRGPRFLLPITCCPLAHTLGLLVLPWSWVKAGTFSMLGDRVGIPLVSHGFIQTLLPSLLKKVTHPSSSLNAQSSTLAFLFSGHVTVVLGFVGCNQKTIVLFFLRHLFRTLLWNEFFPWPCTGSECLGHFRFLKQSHFSNKMSIPV